MLACHVIYPELRLKNESNRIRGHQFWNGGWRHLLYSTLSFFYKQRVYKQLALGWHISKQPSGINPTSLKAIDKEKWNIFFAINVK